MKTDKIISIVVPFRCENDNSKFLICRLEGLLSSIPSDSRIEVLVVDSGSKYEFRFVCKQICDKFGAQYLYHDTFGSSFAIGLARDFGVQHAKSEFITFMDVDLRVSNDFWGRLINLMFAWGMRKYKNRFLAIPCMYLTELGERDFNSKEGDEKFLEYYVKYLQG